MRASSLLFVLVANVAWFGMGFSFFWLRARRAVRILIPVSARDETSAQALTASLPFLGGLNLGFAVLSGCYLLPCIFAGAAVPTWHVYAASAVAHTTQWAANLPHARRGGRSGGAPWDVLRGPMLFIFVMDAVCALLNAAAAVVAATV
jgi:hypothetical protein